MPTNKNAQLRYRILDRCFSDFHRTYSIEDLLDTVNESLMDLYGSQVSIRQIREDIKYMRDRVTYNAPIETYPFDGRKSYYRYSDPSFSIFNNELTAEEIKSLRSTIDILHEAPGVNLKALFAPEHGVRGDAYAGSHVEDFKDPKTGIPVYSIYGSNRKPSKKMLEGLDIVVYDIQDIGSRSYTFISTLGLVMRACAENGIEVMVLDRPNPLGGNKIEGCIVEPGFFSFVSEFRIPYIYGLTVGELAILVNAEGLNWRQKGNEGHLSCSRTVIPMGGWTRDMTYLETGLPWVRPSPNIP